MEKIKSALCIAVLLASLAACGNPGKALIESTGEPSGSSQIQRGSLIPAQYTNLVQLCDTIAKPGLYWRCELPGMEYGREHIAVTKELQTEIYKILTEHEPLLQPDLLDDHSRDRTGDGIFIGIDGSDDGIYSNGDQLAWAVMTPLGPNDPIAPNSVFLPMGMDEDAYTYPLEVYDKLLSLLRANIVETHADFEGEYTRMTLSNSEVTPNWGETMELGDMLLHTSYGGSSVMQINWQLEAFALNTGKSLYSIQSSSGYADRGGLLRISALNDTPDYDYVLYFEKGYAYRNSKDSAQELYFPLPAEVKPIWDDSKSNTTYDQYGDSIVWEEEGSIYLRTAKQDGTAQKLILPNTELPQILADSDLPDGLAYLSPRFMRGGTKVAATVYSALNRDSYAVVIYDIPSGKVSEPHLYLPPHSANYPILDRYVAVGNFTLFNLYDAETGQVTEFPQMRIARSYDYKTVIIADYQTLDQDNAPTYVCDINNPEDRSKPLLRSRQPKALVTVTDVTEHYAVFRIRDYDGDWMAVAKYK